MFVVVTESVNGLKPNGNYKYHICNVGELLFWHTPSDSQISQ